MSPSLLLVAALLYLGVGVGYYRTQQPGMALAFVAYALANVGFAWDAWT